MTSIPRVVNCRKEISLNLQLLHQLQPMLPNVAKAIFEENGLDKPTQNLFNNISYYLLFLIDPQFHSAMTWPLFDTGSERAFRSEFSRFISEHAAKGLLTNVRSSYLVHPSCYKITILLYELSILAVKQTLLQIIKGTEKQKLYNDVTEKYNKRSDNKIFVEYMKSLDYENNILDKVSMYLHKKQCIEKIAEKLRTKITRWESMLRTLNPQGYINRIIDSFIEKQELEESVKREIIKIKNVNESAPIFDEWLMRLDIQLDNIEGNWDDRVMTLLEKCRNMRDMSEELIKRQTGQIDKCSYMLVYDPEKDVICTNELQNHVNSCQKYVLKNIEQNGVLSYPNLIQAFVISICHVLKNFKFGNDIHDFSSRVRVYQREYSEIPPAFKVLIDRVDWAQKKLKVSPAINIQSILIKECFNMPHLPDLSDLKMNQNQYQVNFDTFTPLNLSKHHFNLGRRGEVFSRPQPKSIFSSYHGPKDDFLKTLLACRVSAYDRVNTSQNCNISVLSNIKANETIAECSSGFTKQQIARLLSTKKKSSIKKKKKQVEGSKNVKIVKGDLFNESVISNDSNCLFRSYSSPNLFERDKRPISNIRGRQLSIMAEDCPPHLDVSGIACLDSHFNTPTGFGNAESSRNTNEFPKLSSEIREKLANVEKDLESVALNYQESYTKTIIPSKIPRIIVTHKSEEEIYYSKTERAKELHGTHFAKTVTQIELPSLPISPIVDQESHPKTIQEPHIDNITAKEPTRKLQERYHSLKTITPRESLSPKDMQNSDSRTVTPKPNTALIKKTSSLEKIINRFKQVRSKVVPLREENENFNLNEGPINRNLLPDLLSPSCSMLNGKSKSDDGVDSMCSDTDNVCRKPRNSLGTMLGVDHTFLDQYDLIE